MVTVNFSIPLSREDLLSEQPDQYYVRGLVPCENIPRRLADCNTAFSEDGFLFLHDHFDTFFSVIHLAKDISTRHIVTAQNIILKGMAGMTQSLLGLLEDMNSYQREKLLNVGKMYLYLLSEILRVMEERFNLKTDKDIAVDVKSRKKAIKSFMDFDWDERRNATLLKLYDFIQQPLQKLWEPPIADEDFVNLAANCCYKILEDPQVSQARLSYLRETTFDILGTLILRYSHGLSSTVKIVQLIKLYEHLPETLAQAAVRFVQDYQSRNFVREVIREITQAETGFESSSPKAYSHFLVEIARIGPEIILPSMPLLLPELDNESYMMRNCVLEVIGEIVSQILTKEHLSDEQKRTRDDFLENLEEHLRDTNATVRSKVLKIWQRLCQEKAIPLARLSQLLNFVAPRLEDVSWSVTRNAVQLYHALLQSNPFGDKLEIQKLKEKLDEEETLLAHLEKEFKTQVPRPRAQQWDEITPKIIVVLQEALSSGNPDQELPESIISNSLSENVELVSRYLESEKYLDAYYVLRHIEKLSDSQNLRDDKQLEWLIDHYVNILRKIYLEFDEKGEGGNRRQEKPDLTNEQKEAQERLLRQRTLTQYLKDCIVFAEQLETATNLINNLLFSAQPSVILDSLEFLTAAFQFGLKGALTGVQNMLLLVWSSETSVREGVAASYRQLYVAVSSHAGGRSRAGEIVKNLCHLLKTLNEDQQAALEVLVNEWVKKGDIDKDCFQIMWERFSMKLPDTSEEDSRSALTLLAMVGSAEPNVLKTNIPVLVSVGLGERGNKDYRLVKETCRALLKLAPEKNAVTSNDEPFRLENNHEVFLNLCSMLKNGFCRFDDQHYIAMAYEAIDVIYQLSENPDKTCVELLKSFVDQIKSSMPSDGFDELLNPTLNQEQKSAQQNGNNVPIEMLKRLVFFIGHLAFRQWLHLDRAVFRELKRRNRIRELEAEKKRGDKQNHKAHDKRKSVANLNSSLLSRASETPRLKKDKEKEDAADADIGEINADDAEADYVNHVCETEIVTGDAVLAILSPVVVNVCANPQKYTNSKICSSACLALTKLMLVSSTFCEENLSLVFTMLEKSREHQIRSCLVYAVGDLANRFPNLIEPWTKHLYARLQDESPQVRLDTIVVLKHLITNEMVKVRGQISDMALCIVDPEERISVMATEFFEELSKKGNTLYNVMPDIISRLSNPSMNVSEDHFHSILQFLLPLIHKEKQMESLVDKLCQRFRASTTERQWSDIAFCLSLIQYSDRSLRRLTENFACYSDKLNTDKVLEAFNSIISQASKTNKPERKVLVEELQGKIDESLKRGLGNGAAPGQAEDGDESNIDIDGGSQKENRVLHAKKNKSGRGKKMVRRKGRRKNRHDSSDDEEEDGDSDDEDDTPAQLKVRQRNRRGR